MAPHWRTGLFRVWVVASLLWAFLATYVLYFHCEWNPFNPSGMCFDDLIPFGLDDRLAKIAVPPMVILLIGLAVDWCAQGFRRTR